MTNDERIKNLEQRLEKLEAAHDLVTRQLVEARVDQWQGRIDDLKLQVHLGTVEATDRIAALTAELDKRWSRARQQLAIAGATTSEVTETIRSGLESAYKDVRDALVESRKQLT
jgi:DNA repair exonuclease SbcCD ATPase subunit